MLMRFVKVIREGGKIPRWYGIAYRAVDYEGCVCLPIPLNLLVGWTRWVLIGMKHGWAPPPTTPEFIARARMHTTTTPKSPESAFNDGWNMAIQMYEIGQIPKPKSRSPEKASVLRI